MTCAMLADHVGLKEGLGFDHIGLEYAVFHSGLYTRNSFCP